MKKVLSALCIIIGMSASAQELILYKQVDTTELYLEIHKPKKMKKEQAYPAMVFFFGGGWNGGSRSQFRPHAEYFTKKGVVCFLADYRVKKVHGTDPFTSLSDAKSAIRFVRAHAEDYQIDTARIIASGGSAGGHLAAATALALGYDDPKEDLNISCQPNALVVFNGVVDNGPGGYGYERIGDQYHQFSPLHNIRKGAPPTLLMLGTNDHLIPVTMHEYYKMVMDKVGSQCVLKIYEGGKHGFFNYNAKDKTFFKSTIYDTQVFLESIGFIEETNIITEN
ncbi:MAG: alpha/beta hydrolase [Bacteroidales bacterium]|nr:alpha/beta hydrolase [Bacteroidales bacterium]